MTRHAEKAHISWHSELTRVRRRRVCKTTIQRTAAPTTSTALWPTLLLSALDPTVYLVDTQMLLYAPPYRTSLHILSAILAHHRRYSARRHLRCTSSERQTNVDLLSRHAHIKRREEKRHDAQNDNARGGRPDGVGSYPLGRSNPCWAAPATWAFLVPLESGLLIAKGRRDQENSVFATGQGETQQ